MPLLKDEDRDQLMQEFSGLDAPVDLVMFTQSFECQYCKETRQISEEIAALSDKINLQIFDFVEDAEVAEQYNIDKIPAIAVLKGGDEPKDYDIRFYGIPSGYEFGTLIEDIKMVSSGHHHLTAETVDYLQNLDQDLHLQVYITPTCPHCPRAVYMAHQMAFVSDKVRGDMVEAMEFPHLSMKYQVQGVPRTVINEDTHIEGAAPEHMVMAKVQEALQA